MLPSEMPKFPTDPLVRGFPGIWKLLLFNDSLLCLCIFYLLSYLLLKTMGCLSGCLVSSAGVQKLLCGIFSAFKWSLDEFVGKKVVSPSYSSAILGPPPSRVTLFCSTDFSLQWLILLPSMDFKMGGLQVLWRTGLVALRHVGSSWIKDWTHIPCTGRWILNHWATREVMRHLSLIQPSHSPLEITPFVTFGYLFICLFWLFFVLSAINVIINNMV